MAAQRPTARPKASLEDIEKIIEPYLDRLGDDDKVILVGVRAYYRDRMGLTGKNDYGMYDDALFWIAPSAFAGYNGNTDPSRLGWNPNADKYMARLQGGLWRYKKWKHKQKYWAFGQNAPVTVDRVKNDGTVAKTETGYFGINVHRGLENSTSSEGCVTTTEDQWDVFKEQGYYLLDRFEQDDFPFILDVREDV